MADEGTPSRPELIEPTPARKPRGRPPGSKNKPKPPIVVTRESEATLRPVVLQVSPGCDVVAAVSAFARRRGVGVSVLSGRGAVAAVALRLPTSPAAASTVTLHGRFEVLSLSGTVLPPPPSSELGGAAVPPPFSVSLAGTGGQVIGGTLAGEMTAAADGMVVVAATFGSAEVHWLPTAEDEEGGSGRGGGPVRPEDVNACRPEDQEQPMVVAAGIGGVGLGGRGSGGHVGHYQQQPEMGFWAQSSGTRGPVHQPSSSHF